MIECRPCAGAHAPETGDPFGHPPGRGVVLDVTRAMLDCNPCECYVVDGDSILANRGARTSRLAILSVHSWFKE